jgi:putative acetyltransferase
VDGEGWDAGGKSLNRGERGEMRAAPVQIRQAAVEDCTAIAGVLYQSFVEFKPLYTNGGFAATTPAAAQVEMRMREGPLWIALSDGVIVGTVSAVKKGESAYIRGMAVLPATRGSGAGARLLHEVELWAASEGLERLFLSTTPFLDSAIRLYERSGFRRTDDGPHDLFGTPLFTMEKVIGT